MPKTTRKREKKQISTDKQDQSVENNIQKSFPAFLSSQHLMDLETISRDVENTKLQMAVEEQALKNMLLEEYILKMNIEKQKLNVKAKAANYENEKKKFSEYKRSLWPQYGFAESEGLGYNVLTGEIISQKG